MFALWEKYGRGFGAAALAVAVPLISSVIATGPISNIPMPTDFEGRVAGAPGITSPQGVGGTTDADLEAFADAFNAQRADHDLRPVPLDNFRYDACMEERLFWMAEDPSDAPASAWGHLGSERSDGLPSKGCDGNLAGGMNNTGETVATKWWNSPTHRASLYKPAFAAPMTSACIYFAMTHGGVPNEPTEFSRAAARWHAC